LTQARTDKEKPFEELVEKAKEAGPTAGREAIGTPAVATEGLEKVGAGKKQGNLFASAGSTEGLIRLVG
jgi:hypothetical protein